MGWTTKLATACVVMVAVLFFLTLEVRADCYVDSTAGFVAFWRAWEPDWCGSGTEGIVEDAFNYWGIGDQPGELVVLVEAPLTDSPEIRLSHLERDLLGKRVALFSTHGSDPLWNPAGMAVEYYATARAAYTACSTYCADSYDESELKVGQTPSERAWVVVITNEGIQNHLSQHLEMFDAMIYGDYCFSKHTMDAWSVATFLGYEYGPETSKCCENLDKVWVRLACGAHPWRGHQVDDALRYDVTELHSWGVNQSNQLDCSRDCWDNPPAVMLGSQWAYNEGDAVILGWHAEAEWETKEYQVEGGTGKEWEVIGLVARASDPAPHVYSVKVMGGYDIYRIVEVDRIGSRSEFRPMRPADEAPHFAAGLLDTARQRMSENERWRYAETPCWAAVPVGGSGLEHSSQEVADWVFYGPDSLLAECGPAISWFESRGLVVDVVPAPSGYH